MPQRLARRAGLDHHAEVHHRDDVGDVAHDREVVRDQEQPEARARARGRRAGSRAAPAPTRRARRAARRATITDGSAASARAIAIRWRWPPRELVRVARRPRSPGSPTSSSSSRDARRAPRRGDEVERHRARRASCAPTFRRGLSDEYGFWKTSCSRTSSRGRARRVSGVDRRALEDDRARPSVGTSPTAARASVDLPQPDSPTRPTIWPALDGQARAGDRAHAARRRAARSRRRRREARARSSAANGSTGQASRRSPTWTSGGHLARAARRARRRSGGGRRSRPGSRRGVGGAPAIATSGLSGVASGCGSASSSARVYGWRGRCEHVLARARTRRRGRRRRSTTRSAIADITPRSCVIRIDREVVLAAQPVEQPQDPGLDGDVERGRRLVGDQQLRPAGERDRDRDPLAHPARELVRVRVQRRARGPGSAPRRAARPRARRAARRSSPRCRRTCSVSWRPIESIGCSDVIGSWKTIASSRPATSRSRAARHAAAGRGRRSGRCPSTTAPSRQQPEQREHRHRLAAAALAGDAEHLARLDGVVDAVDDRDEPGRASAAGRAAPRPRAGSRRVSSRRHAVRGSKTSRRLSPRKLNASTTVKIARPGNVPDPPPLEVLRPVGDHRPPLRRRRLRAEPEEREAREQQDRVREVERREHEHRARRRSAGRRGRARAGATRRAAAPTARTPSRRPRARARARRARTTARRRRRSRAPRSRSPRPSTAATTIARMIGGNAKTRSATRMSDAVDEPAEVAGDRADRRRRSTAASATSRSAIGSDDARAVDHAAEDVAPELVGAEQVVAATATATGVNSARAGRTARSAARRSRSRSTRPRSPTPDDRERLAPGRREPASAAHGSRRRTVSERAHVTRILGSITP